jgi:hypothetical protein
MTSVLGSLRGLPSRGKHDGSPQGAGAIQAAPQDQGSGFARVDPGDSTGAPCLERQDRVREGRKST